MMSEGSLREVCSAAVTMGMVVASSATVIVYSRDFHFVIVLNNFIRIIITIVLHSDDLGSFNVSPRFEISKFLKLMKLRFLVLILRDFCIISEGFSTLSLSMAS